jgi:hypothetical protein
MIFRFARRQLSPKARAIFVAGNVCLILGISLGLFDHDLSPQRHLWFDFLRGFLLGSAIVFQFATLRMSRRCAPIPPLN